MKIKYIVSLVLFCLVATVSIGQNYELRFNIVNDTDIDLYGVYVSPSAVNNWGPDVLTSDTFDAGTSVTVTIPVNDQTLCVYDIKVTDYDDEGRIFPEIDFCELSTLIFYVGSDGEIYFRVQ